MQLFGYKIGVTKTRETTASDVSVPANEKRNGGGSTITVETPKTSEKKEERSSGPGVSIPFSYRGFTGGVQKASITTTSGTQSVLSIPTVFACIKILSNQLASLPLVLKKQQSDGYYLPEKNHPAYRLLRRPNKYQTGFDFRRALYALAYLFGNGVAYIKRDGAGRPVEAHVVPAINVSVGDYEGQLYYIIRPLSPSGQLMPEIILPASDVIHIKDLSLDVTGIDIIQAQSSAYGLAIAVQTYANQYFTNGASFSGVVEHPLELKDTGIQNLKAGIKEQQTSTGSILVLEEGAKYNKLNDTMVNSGVVDVRKYSRVEIASNFGVPLFMINENSGTTFSNMAEMSRYFCQNTLVPMCEQAEAQFDLVLLSESDFNNERFKFEHDFLNLLRGDAKTQLEITRMMVGIGALRLNEVRDWQGYDRDPNLDVYLTPLNMTKSDGAVDQDPQTKEANSE
jgi:HK97 family phage portal protein